MSQIRYWDDDRQTPGVGGAARQSQAVSRVNQDFQLSLLDQLSKGDQLLSGSGQFGGMGDSMFGDPTKQLMNIDIEGKEKIWAAQLSSPMGFFHNSSSAGMSSGSGMGALDSVISLSVQAQMVKARNQLQKNQDRYSLAEFVKDVVPDSAAEKSRSYSNIEEFVAFIRSEIDRASSNFGLKKGELKQYLDL